MMSTHSYCHDMIEVTTKQLLLPAVSELGRLKSFQPTMSSSNACVNSFANHITFEELLGF